MGRRQEEREARRLKAIEDANRVFPPKETAGPPPAEPQCEPAPETHVCYRCHKAPGVPVFCGFCASVDGGRPNARVQDMFDSKPSAIDPAAWRRAVYAMIDACNQSHNAAALSAWVDQNYPIVRGVVMAVIGAS